MQLQSFRWLLASGLILATLVAVGINVADAGAAPEQERVIAGTTADPAAWPFIGALYLKPRGSHGKAVLDCGATVIASRAAVTAAHCSGHPAKSYSLIVGRPNLADRSVGQEIPIRSIEANPAYARTPRADLAVLTLARDAGVTPAGITSVAQNNAATVVGAPLRVAGWGATRSNGSQIAKRLMTTAETVLDGAPCKRDYGELFSNVTTICTQGAKLASPREGHAGSCYGDSGGPLIADTVAGPLLVGAVSGGGLRCGTTADYHTRISANLPFIARTSASSQRRLRPSGPQRHNTAPACRAPY